MLYDSTKTLLRSILQSLEIPGPAEWDGRIEAANQAVYEIHQMSGRAHSPCRPERPDPKRPASGPDPEKLSRATPYVKLMASAIRRHDQAAAIASGKAALAAL